ncbi:Guanine nucleotide-binding protein G(t) subunit alpha-2 [Clydaea vesicula]|uniref:Guanine nucleotide-binding protein G(T) subunit alpha-2 n=1 Tax=Clydaea vesicula TaxID=447962 RepID=A0AAD5U807_9FUNG|nr:Guanine nucleotide-binding protein G(t) subunit alpha-2 [Clydaea vesicula]KAJ3396639.1 Guanine nucleotide-binding protein G(t) subunit alpha-2 [Lobulomyces angularis]
MQKYSEDVNVNLSSLVEEGGINLQEELQLDLPRALLRHKFVEKQIKKDLEASKLKGIKLLVLGSGDSGKSTFIRQMRILSNSSTFGFTLEEKDYFKFIIFDNIIQIFKNLLLILSLVDNSLFEKFPADLIDQINNLNCRTDFKEDTFSKLKDIWSHDTIKFCFEQRTNFVEENVFFQDTAAYFMNNLDRFLRLDYVLLDQDIVCCRKQTIGMLETEIIVKPKKLRIFDFGGQKQYRYSLTLIFVALPFTHTHQFSRNYWAPYFDDCKAIIFLSAISSYDQYLTKEEEDLEATSKTNRMVDSLELFSSLINNPILINTKFILFFNKFDLFQTKIKTIKISDYFHEFKGHEGDILPQNERTAKSFFKKKFIDCCRKDNAELMMIHYTNSTDSKVMKKVVNSVIAIIFQGNVQSTGLMDDRM